ncbi:hypothetical protein F4801DRAFT_73071 [Xylaria longipes]|nr:hypothetical protein F4801DRAFT_73071 [Xylaria longipes]
MNYNLPLTGLLAGTEAPTPAVPTQQTQLSSPCESIFWPFRPSSLIHNEHAHCSPLTDTDTMARLSHSRLTKSHVSLAGRGVQHAVVSPVHARLFQSYLWSLLFSFPIVMICINYYNCQVRPAPRHWPREPNVDQRWIGAAGVSMRPKFQTIIMPNYPNL